MVWLAGLRPAKLAVAEWWHGIISGHDQEQVEGGLGGHDQLFMLWHSMMQQLAFKG